MEFVLPSESQEMVLAVLTQTLGEAEVLAMLQAASKVRENEEIEDQAEVTRRVRALLREVSKIEPWDKNGIDEDAFIALGRSVESLVEELEAPATPDPGLWVERVLEARAAMRR